MRTILIIICSFVLISQANSNHRGLWVVRHTLLDSPKSEQLVPDAVRLKITDLYIQVRALGRTFFERDSAFTPNMASPAFRNFKNILMLAHKNNIKVHAWINAFFINVSIDNSINNHFFGNEQNKYLLRRAGDLLPPSHKELRKAGIEGDFTDPLNQKNLSYIKSVSTYLIDSLKVDGIHLDYFRYPGFSFSFSPAGRSDFILKYYCDPVDIYLNNGNIDPLHKYTMGIRYKEFLSKNIKTALQEIQKTIQRRNTNVILSIAVKANSVLAEKIYVQNWQSWLREKLCDRIILMNYNNQDSVFYKNLRSIEPDLNKKRIVVGIATYNQEIQKIIERINRIKASAFAGYTLFSYNDIKEKQTLFELLGNKSGVTKKIKFAVPGTKE